MFTNPQLKIIISTLVQSWGKILSVGLSALSILILTRYLGVQGYGNFSLIFAYLTFFTAFTDFGLQNTIVNKLSKKEITENEIFGTYFFLKIIVISITVISSLVILIFMPYSHLIKFAILFSSIGVGIGSLGGFGNTFFQYRIKLELVTFIDLINKALAIAFTVFFIFAKLDFIFILFAVLLSNLLSIILMFYILGKDHKFNYQFNKTLASQLLRESTPIGIAGILTATYFKLDTIMLSVFKGAADVGIYSLAYKVFENVLIIWTYYMSSFYPYISRFYHSEDWVNYKKLIKNSILGSILFSFAIIIVGYFLAPLAITIFGGSDFSTAILPLRILLFSSVFVFINSIYYVYLFLKGRTSLIIISLLASLFFNFLINLFVIPRYGFIGASATTVLTEVFLFFFYLFFAFKVSKSSSRP